MKKTLILVLCVLMLVTVAAAYAANTGLAGKNEVMGSGAWIKASNDADVKLTILGTSYGKYFTNNWEGQLGFIYAKTSGDEDAKAWIIAPAAVYNFTPKQSSAIVPYLGAGLAYAKIDGFKVDDSSTKLQYFGGCKFFLGGNYDTATKSVFIEYRRTNASIEDVDVDIDMIWSGISVIF